MVSGEDYLIMCEILRKMEFNENYEPTDHELEVIASILEQENNYRRSKIWKYSTKL